MAKHRIGPWLSSSFNPGGRNIFNHHYHRMGRSTTSHVGSPEPVIASNRKLALQIPSGASISQVYDPQSVLAKHTMGATAFNAQIKGEPGHHTFFVYTHQGEMDWWQPVNIYIENTRKAPPIQTLQISVPKNAGWLILTDN